MALPVAGSHGMYQQFAVRPRDGVNPMRRSAGILVPEQPITGLLAGFGQIESQAIDAGMIGEATRVAKPGQIIFMMVVGVQPVVASGQVRQTDPLVDVQQMGRPGSITVVMEPLYKARLDDLPWERTASPTAIPTTTTRCRIPTSVSSAASGCNLVDTVGLVHALIHRIQALLLPIQTLVLGGL